MLYFIPPPTRDPVVRRCSFPPHLRGQVFKVGDVWHMQVINERTGKIIAQDNTGSWRRIQDACDEVTGAVRLSWSMGFGSKAVRM